MLPYEGKHHCNLRLQDCLVFKILYKSSSSSRQSSSSKLSSSSRSCIDYLHLQGSFHLQDCLRLQVFVFKIVFIFKMDKLHLQYLHLQDLACNKLHLQDGQTSSLISSSRMAEEQLALAREKIEIKSWRGKK
nr:hypothetical protein CFP56_07151 [Quercus suber]